MSYEERLDRLEKEVKNLKEFTYTCKNSINKERFIFFNEWFDEEVIISNCNTSEYVFLWNLNNKAKNKKIKEYTLSELTFLMLEHNITCNISIKNGIVYENVEIKFKE